MPRVSRTPGLDAPRSGDGGDGRPAWFIAAFEDGKATPDFLAGYEVDLRAALESAGVECIVEAAGGREAEEPGRGPRQPTRRNQRGTPRKAPACPSDGVRSSSQPIFQRRSQRRHV